MNVAGKFAEWARGFFLITEEHIYQYSCEQISNTEQKTLEEVKIEFSDRHQELFEASWNLQKLKKFPVEEICIYGKCVSFSEHYYSLNVFNYENGANVIHQLSYPIDHPNIIQDGTQMFLEQYGNLYNDGYGSGNPFCHEYEFEGNGYGVCIEDYSHKKLYGYYGQHFLDGSGVGKSEESYEVFYGVYRAGL